MTTRLTRVFSHPTCFVKQSNAKQSADQGGFRTGLLEPCVFFQEWGPRGIGPSVERNAVPRSALCGGPMCAHGRVISVHLKTSCSPPCCIAQTHIPVCFLLLQSFFCGFHSIHYLSQKHMEEIDSLVPFSGFVPLSLSFPLAIPCSAPLPFPLHLLS